MTVPVSTSTTLIETQSPDGLDQSMTTDSRGPSPSTWDPGTQPTLWEIAVPPSQLRHACTGVGCVFCTTTEDAKAATKIRQAAQAADRDWMWMAENLMRTAARKGIDFTTDEIMEQLDGLGLTTKDPRALGAVVRKMTKAKVMVEVGMTKSRRRHGARIPVYCGMKAGI